MSDCVKKLDDFLKSAEEIDAQYRQLVFAECRAVLGKHISLQGSIKMNLFLWKLMFIKKCWSRRRILRSMQDNVQI